MGAAKPPAESSRAESPQDAEVRQDRAVRGLWGWIAFVALFVLWVWGRP